MSKTDKNVKEYFNGAFEIIKMSMSPSNLMRDLTTKTQFNVKWYIYIVTLWIRQVTVSVTALLLVGGCKVMTV